MAGVRLKSVDMGHEARRSIADAVFFFSEFGACFLDTVAGRLAM